MLARLSVHPCRCPLSQTVGPQNKVDFVGRIMVNNQSSNQARITALKILGIICIMGGLYAIVLEVGNGLISKGVPVEIFRLIFASFFIPGGYDLFRLKASGRRTILVLLCWQCVIGILIFLRGVIGNDYSLTYRFLKFTFQMDNPVAYYSIAAAFVFIPGIAVAFLSLSQNKIFFEDSHN